MTVFLFCVDGSDNSKHAFESAVQLVKAEQDLCIFGIVAGYEAIGFNINPDTFPVPRGPMYKELDSIRLEAAHAAKEARRRAQKILDQYATECVARNIRHRTVVLAGNPREELIRFIKDELPDFVVVGCRGLGQVKRLLLGSVSDYLVHHAGRPVIVIPNRKVDADLDSVKVDVRTKESHTSSDSWLPV